MKKKIHAANEKYNEIKNKAHKLKEIIQEKDISVKYFVLVLDENNDSFVVKDFTYSIEGRKIFDYNGGRYTLNNPSMTYLSKPLYIIKEGFNISIQFEALNKNLLEKYKSAKDYTETIKGLELEKAVELHDNERVINNWILVEKGYSPVDMLNACEGQVAEVVFKPVHKRPEKWFAITAMLVFFTNFISILITYILMI